MLCVSFLSGAAAALSLGPTAEVAAVAAAAAGGLLLFALGGPRSLALLGPLLFALGLVQGGGTFAPAGPIVAVSGHDVELRGLVVADPTLAGSGQDLRIAVRELRVGGESQESGGVVLLRSEAGVSFRYGDEIAGMVTLESLDLSERGSQFERYLAERGVSATGFLRSAVLVSTGGGNALRRGVGEARSSLDAALAAALPEPLAGVAQGIATGRRDGVDRALRDDLNTAGISHLVVISGSNVALLAMLVTGALAWLIGRRQSVVVALLLVAAYTVFVGADAPVVRAAIMATMLLSASLLGRRTSATPMVALAAALMVAWEPTVLRDLSFQLSFAATASISLIAVPLRERAFERLGLG